ncbi:hypothetical protein V5O48_015756 [Marasmius crinis-equi]|uniref:Uncharacterized protein n=1 Tax=Marasmius crinis-equi TaxID=585013 RepID=A0ABR3ETM5_9AGAR
MTAHAYERVRAVPSLESTLIVEILLRRRNGNTSSMTPSASSAFSPSDSTSPLSPDKGCIPLGGDGRGSFVWLAENKEGEGACEDWATGNRKASKSMRALVAGDSEIAWDSILALAAEEVA